MYVPRQIFPTGPRATHKNDVDLQTTIKRHAERARGADREEGMEIVPGYLFFPRRRRKEINFIEDDNQMTRKKFGNDQTLCS